MCLGSRSQIEFQISLAVSVTLERFQSCARSNNAMQCTIRKLQYSHVDGFTVTVRMGHKIQDCTLAATCSVVSKCSLQNLHSRIRDRDMVSMLVTSHIEPGWYLFMLGLSHQSACMYNRSVGRADDGWIGKYSEYMHPCRSLVYFIYSTGSQAREGRSKLDQVCHSVLDA